MVHDSYVSATSISVYVSGSVGSRTNRYEGRPSPVGLSVPRDWLTGYEVGLLTKKKNFPEIDASYHIAMVELDISCS